MSRITLRFPRIAKSWLYGNLLLSLGSGVLWFVLHRWGQRTEEFGPSPNPLEPWLLKVHGASAFLAMIGFGYLLASHVSLGWRSRRNRVQGLTLIALILVLIGSGYLLYYTANESIRAIISWIHLASGLILPFVLGWHVFAARRHLKPKASLKPLPCP